MRLKRMNKETIQLSQYFFLRFLSSRFLIFTNSSNSNNVPYVYSLFEKWYFQVVDPIEEDEVEKQALSRLFSLRIWLFLPLFFQKFSLPIYPYFVHIFLSPIKVFSGRVCDWRGYGGRRARATAWGRAELSTAQTRRTCPPPARSSSTNTRKILKEIF